MSESNLNIYFDLKEDDMGEYGSIYASIDQWSKQLLTDKITSVLKMLDNFRENNHGRFYVIKVTGLLLAILLKQDPTTTVFLKTSKF